MFHLSQAAFDANDDGQLDVLVLNDNAAELHLNLGTRGSPTLKFEQQFRDNNPLAGLDVAELSPASNAQFQDLDADGTQVCVWSLSSGGALWNVIRCAYTHFHQAITILSCGTREAHLSARSTYLRT